MKKCNGCCAICVNDCKEQGKQRCVNFRKSVSNRDYWKQIRQQNVNLKKICKKNSLKYGKMLDMLNGKIDFKYKYHVALENRLYEKELYIPYLEGFIDV